MVVGSDGVRADGSAPSASFRPRRRAVTAGLAWALPVVAVGAAAPAFAASGCSTFSFALDDSHAAYDQVTVTNTGTRVLPAGTTITWLVRNRATTNATLAITAVSGVTASPTSAGITAGGTTTFTFTLSAPLAAGAALYWRYTITGWNYATRVTINGCAGATACLSSLSYTPGTACPETPLAGAGARAANGSGGSDVFPDPRVIPPK